MTNATDGVRHTAAEPRGSGLVPYPAEARARYRELGFWQGRDLGDELRRSAAAHHARTALVTAEVRWSYAELDQRSQLFAAGLLASTTLRPGDAVMFSMGNVAETVVSYYGALRAGLIPVCTLPQHGRRELRLLAEHIGARGHVVQADFRDYRLAEVAAEVAEDSDTLDELIVARGAAGLAGQPGRRRAHSYRQISAAGADPAAQRGLAEVAMDPETVAVFQLSGGTTGLPKVAPRRHEEYAYNSRRWAEALGWGRRPRCCIRFR